MNVVVGFILGAAALVAAWTVFSILSGARRLRRASFVAESFELRAITEGDLGAGVRAHFQKTARALEKAGFDFVQLAEMRDYVPDSAAQLGLFYKQDEGIHATTTGLFQDGRLEIEYDEVLAEYRDGTTLAVNNSPIRGAFDDPEKKILRFRGVDAARLVDVFRWVAREEGRAAAPVKEPTGDPIKELRDSAVRDVEVQCELGRRTLDHADGLYKLTWNGAVRMAAALLWPLKAVLEGLDQARAEDILEQVDEEVPAIGQPIPAGELRRRLEAAVSAETPRSRRMAASFDHPGRELLVFDPAYDPSVARDEDGCVLKLPCPGAVARVFLEVLELDGGDRRNAAVRILFGEREGSVGHEAGAVDVDSGWLAVGPAEQVRRHSNQALQKRLSESTAVTLDDGGDPWVVAFDAGWGDGTYAWFALEDAGEIVGYVSWMIGGPAEAVD